MANVNLNISVDENILKLANKHFENIGLNLNEAFNNFLLDSIDDDNNENLTGWPATEKALNDSVNRVGVHGHFKTVDEVEAFIDANY